MVSRVKVEAQMIRFGDARQCTPPMAVIASQNEAREIGAAG